VVNLADTLLHEAAHALRLKKGRAMDADYLKKIIKPNGNTKPPIKKPK
jgi:hypothetical protein